MNDVLVYDGDVLEYWVVEWKDVFDVDVVVHFVYGEGGFAV